MTTAEEIFSIPGPELLEEVGSRPCSADGDNRAIQWKTKSYWGLPRIIASHQA